MFYAPFNISGTLEASVLKFSHKMHRWWGFRNFEPQLAGPHRGYPCLYQHQIYRICRYRQWLS